jgi:hypothetical protein
MPDSCCFSFVLATSAASPLRSLRLKAFVFVFAFAAITNPPAERKIEI